MGRRIAGSPGPYESLPWFWSDQGAIKLQIAGLRTGTDEVRVVPGESRNGWPRTPSATTGWSPWRR
ncbi:oxidoreductase C-terminal domain-containing protein [Streptomyces sp. NPDC002838]|uniref:oxidoreductase C-terminal domain-containing protein n=1 Tax=Streptomyces sp. NPDC002838 TaxID=3154436 RepID=UPI0033206055